MTTIIAKNAIIITITIIKNSDNNSNIDNRQSKQLKLKWHQYREKPFVLPTFHKQDSLCSLRPFGKKKFKTMLSIDLFFP